MTHERRVVEQVDRVHDPLVDPTTDPVVDRRTTTTTLSSGPSGATMARRIVTLLFGILQVLILLRIVLLLLAANQDNGIVSAILGVTDPFIEPFRGIFQIDSVRGRTGSILDLGAIVALVGWTLIEALVLAIIGITDRRSATVI